MAGDTAQRLVLWNIDDTLVDVAKVTRDAYADAFHAITGRPLVHVAPSAGRTDSEIIFETLALNDVEVHDHHLPEFVSALADALAARAGELGDRGRLLPGAERVLVALDSSSDVAQSVVTGNIEPNAVAKLAAFGLDHYLDLEIGGYGSENFPKATLVQVAQSRAAQKYGQDVEGATVVIAGSARDVSAARIAGASVIAVVDGGGTEAELDSEGAEVVLSDLTDTAAVVESVRRLTTPSIQHG